MTLYNFARNISANISSLGQRTHLNLAELFSLFIIHNISQSLEVIHWMGFDFILIDLSVHL